MVVAYASICNGNSAVGLKAVSLGFGWRQVEFSRPAYALNYGSKITIEYIKNPNTGLWERVWGDEIESGKSYRKKWIDEYLEIEGPSDDVHPGDYFRVLKPVTIAIIGIHGDKTEIQLKVSMLPTKNIRLKSPPRIINKKIQQ